ncbi:MAG: SCO family protein [Zetaproteobacteria bacterium]|nr:SCO family protein [Zetaproteobacteria bacterium]
MQKKNALKILGVIVAIGAILYSWNAQLIPKPTIFPQYHAAFTLEGKEGSVSLKDFQGDVRIVFFGYTHCPDICPTTLNRIANALHALNQAQRQHVKAFFISIDPNRDSPTQASEYATYFHPNIIGLSGNKNQIEQAQAAFRSSSENDPIDENGHYSINHDTLIYIIKPDGTMGSIEGHLSSEQQLTESIIRWLP